MDTLSNATFTNQATENLAYSNTDTNEAQTGVMINNNLMDAISTATFTNEAVQNLTNSNADIIEAQIGVAIDTTWWTIFLRQPLLTKLSDRNF